jgi:hypothetical protein
MVFWRREIHVHARLIESLTLSGLGILGLALAIPVIDRRRPQP